jgi:hypothetical protein
MELALDSTVKRRQQEDTEVRVNSSTLLAFSIEWSDGRDSGDGAIDGGREAVRGGEFQWGDWRLAPTTRSRARE